MCRLMATTFTGPLALEVLHEMMWTSALEESGQRDGWGVADNSKIIKSAQWYVEDIPIWKPQLDPSNFMIGHVRKMSTGTGRTSDENHPYLFSVHGRRFVAAHNGWIEGTNWDKWEKGLPQTDSWRALNDLAFMLNEGPDEEFISPDLISQWLSKYQTGSHYAFLLRDQDYLYAIRGTTRTLHILETPEGFLINTSANVLHRMKKYLEQIYGIECDQVLRIMDNNMVRFSLGAVEPVFEVIKPDHKPRVYTNTNTTHYGAWGDSNLPKPAAATTPTTAGQANLGANVERNVERNDVLRTIIAPSVTKPRTKVVVAANLTDELVNESNKVIIVPETEDTRRNRMLDLRNRRRSWSEFCGRLSPLRGSLTRAWSAMSLGYMDNDTPDNKFLAHVSDMELRLLKDMITPEDNEGKIIKPFTETAMLMINWWNHAVKPGQDLPAHMFLFGTDWFWLDTDYVTATDQESYQAALAWRKFVMYRAMETFNNNDLQRIFDIKVFKELLGDSNQHKESHTADI